MDVPLLPDAAMAELSDAELREYVAMLEDAARDKVQRDARLFARAIPLPGAPDKANIMATDWERKLAAEQGRELPPDKPDGNIEFYPQRLDPQPHHDLILEKMQALVEGTLVNADGEAADGVMFFMPPGSAKSSYATMLAPAYFMGRFPGFQTIIASYAQSLTNGFSRRLQAICKLPEYRAIFGVGPRQGNTGVEEWAMENESRLRAAGMLGGITGFRCDLLVCDDPIKNAEDADSEIIRQKIWEEWETSLTTRFKGVERIAVIMTRWHVADLAGRILSNEDSSKKWNGESGFWRGTDKRLWYVVRIPMIADRVDDPLSRKIGDQLWPEKFKPRNVQLRKQTSDERGGTRDWNSLYQQMPTIAGGNIIRREWWQRWTEKDERGHIQPPLCETVLLMYDTAFEKGQENDYNAMTAWGCFPRTVQVGSRSHSQYHMIMLGAWRGKVDAADMPEIIKDHIRFFGADTAYVEKRASGAQILQELKRARAPVKAWLPGGAQGTRGKESRMYAAQFIFANSAVWYIPGKETNLVVDEVCNFPSGTHDDYADTVTMAMDVFRRRYLMQIPTDEWSDEEYDAHHRAELEERRKPRRRLYG